MFKQQSEIKKCEGIFVAISTKTTFVLPTFFHNLFLFLEKTASFYYLKVKMDSFKNGSGEDFVFIGYNSYDPIKNAKTKKIFHYFVSRISYHYFSIKCEIFAQALSRKVHNLLEPNKIEKSDVS